MKKLVKSTNDDLRPEYDLAELLQGGVVGKHAKAYHAGSNLVLLEPEVRNEFKSEKELNDALHLVIELRKIGGGRRAVRR